MNSEIAAKDYSVRKLKSAPLIGMLIPALRDPLEFAMGLSRHADIVCLTVMGQEAVQLNHPDLIRHVLVGNHKNYKKSKPYIRFESAIGLGLLTSNEEKWKRDRQKIQPMFNRDRTAGYYFEVVSEVSEKYKQKWLKLTENSSTELDITDEMARITTEVILKSIFGKNIDDHTVASLHHSYAVLIDYLKSLRILPHIDLRKTFRMPAYFRFKRELENIDRRLQTLADQYRSDGLTDQYNMLALLVEAQKQDAEHFSEKDLRDHAVSMVFAGFESTSILMQWLWYVLDERSDVKERLVEDITLHAPCTAAIDSSCLNYESIRRMNYLSAVLKETMRLYPPFWLTGREPIEDDDLGSFKLKRGTVIALPQIAIHRHPDWWPEPNSFIPERFLNGNEAGIPDGAYFPFSQGPRKCSGHLFVEMEAKTIMAKLLPFFNITALNRVGNPMQPGISLKLRDPLRVRITRR